ncbi:MAG: L-aspartate oxidase [Deltaproteobacteria bacterium]|nr:L-aspartate oxidase [Deltaproteobacteria bacterium]
MARTLRTDHLVIGSGVAGLTYALEAARSADVVILTKGAREDSATRWAQGGIASVMGPDDTVEAHVEDTIATGSGICHPEVVRECAAEGPARIAALEALGVRFTRDAANGSLDLGREGGHSARRIVHAQDMTGREVEDALLRVATAHPRIRFLDHHMAIDLVRDKKGARDAAVLGAFVLDESAGRIRSIAARTTVLATGGAGKTYLYTSNPDVATGDGIAMAYRAGACLADLEFVQFHPTCLYHPEAKNFLLSEAMRGEGATVRRLDGATFLENYDPRGPLAPRDIVARAIDAEMKRTGDDHVLLDMTHLDPAFVLGRFPGIAESCRRYGIEIERRPIPVVPAAHYFCGGVVADIDGRTTLPRLLALGEVACTGLHGANRLASNSLLEGLVLAHRAATAAAARGLEPMPEVPGWDPGDAAPSDERVVVSQDWDEIRRFLWNFVGIVRSDRRLARAARRIALLQEEIREYYWKFLVTSDLCELRNIATVADLVIRCAAFRRESRGLHFTADHPAADPAWARDTLIDRWDGVRLAPATGRW